MAHCETRHHKKLNVCRQIDWRSRNRCEYYPGRRIHFPFMARAMLVWLQVPSCLCSLAPCLEEALQGRNMNVLQTLSAHWRSSPEKSMHAMKEQSAVNLPAMWRGVGHYNKPLHPSQHHPQLENRKQPTRNHCKLSLTSIPADFVCRNSSTTRTAGQNLSMQTTCYTMLTACAKGKKV